jgi:ABC-2 type transport system permease protein
MSGTGTRRVTLPRVMVSEWIKLRSVRSSVYTLGVTVILTVGLGLAFCALAAAKWDSLSPAQRTTVDPTGFSLRGTYLAQLSIGALGVLLITGEYSTGMIRATLSAVPRRLPVLWGKLTVFAGVGLVAMLVSTLAAFTVGQAILSTKHLGVSLGAPGEFRIVAGAALYLTGVGLLGIAAGFLIRNTAGAVTALFGVILVLPLLASILPWNVNPYLPSGAGQAVMASQPDPNMLAPWTGFAVFLGYVAVAVAAAAITVRRRDA